MMFHAGVIVRVDSMGRKAQKENRLSKKEMADILAFLTSDPHV
jgi:hypothetical protein